MQVEIKYFGLIADITKQKTESFQINEMDTIDLQKLRTVLTKQYPALALEVFSLAVNKQLRDDDFIIHEGDEIALLPPFAGG